METLTSLRTYVRRCILAAGLVIASGVEGCNSHCVTLPDLVGVQLDIVDASSGAPLLDVAQLTVTRLSGGPSETRSGSPLAQPSENPLSMTRERPGRFSLQIDAPGYQTWNRDVEVPDVQTACDEGRMAGVRVTAQLTRAP